MPKTPVMSAAKILGSLNSGGSSLGVNVLLVTAGGVLIYAGIKRVSVVDAALGRGGLGAAADPMAGAASTATGSGGDGGAIVTMDGHPVAAWIADELQWARQAGLWRGAVTSGVRSDAEQIAAASSYGLEHYPNGPLASNHVKRNGTAYPHGAVDVTMAEQLAAALRRKPGGSRLVWAGPVIGDTVHFSGNGH